MRFRLLLGSVGFLMGAFGLLRFLQHDLGDVVDSVLWLAGGVLLHDAVLAPLTIALTVLAARVLPRHRWRVAAVVLVVLATVTATAVPVLGGFGVRADNPSLLDRPYVLGWCVLVAVLLVAASVHQLVEHQAHRADEDPDDGDVHRDP